MTTRTYSDDEVLRIKEILLVEERNEDNTQVRRIKQKLFDLCSGMAFFSTFIDQLLPGPEKELAIGVSFVKQLFKTATFEKFNKETPIFLENDSPNDKCYVILSGRVGIYRGKIQCDIKIGGLGKGSEKDETAYPSFKDPIYQGENIKLLKKLSYYGDLLAKMAFGRIFGQTGLLNDNPRNASILTLEETELMVFHKSALEAIKELYTKDLNERKTFIMAMIPEMQLINDPLRIMKLIEFFKPQKYKHGQYLTKEGESDVKLIFMQEGEVTMSKVMTLPEIVDNRNVSYSDHEVPIASIQGHAIIGEEILEPHATAYKYSVQVKSADIKTLVFEKSSNFADFKAFPLFALLLKGYRAKE